MYDTLLADTKLELGISIGETTDDAVLRKYLRDAVAWVNNRRNYTPAEGELCESRFLPVVVRLAVYSYAKRGGEGQTSHGENGVSRTWAGGGTYPPDVLREVPMVVKPYANSR
jgi:hypothetical protein